MTGCCEHDMGKRAAVTQDNNRSSRQNWGNAKCTEKPDIRAKDTRTPASNALIHSPECPGHLIQGSIMSNMSLGNLPIQLAPCGMNQDHTMDTIDQTGPKHGQP